MLTQYLWILFALPTIIIGTDFLFEDPPDGVDKEISLVQEVEFGEVLRRCRVSGGRTLQPILFELHTCALCYYHIDNALFKKQEKFTYEDIVLRDPKTNATFLANVSDPESPIWDTFSSTKAQRLWKGCCRAAVTCCQNMNTTQPTKDPSYCPRTWDGWNCWPDTPSGVTADSLCPPHVYFHSDPPDCQRFATKVCTKNGTWFRNVGKREWSNYTSCGQTAEIRVLLTNHIVTFGISIATIVPALFIFSTYKQLQVFRIFMHKNLFASLLLNGIFVIVFEAYFMTDSLNNGQNSVIEANTVGCKLFYTLTKYLRLSTYVWMFCEGFYLHKLIAAAFAEQKNKLVFYLFGWGFPILPVSIWAILRQQKADYGCWTTPANNYEWVIFVPMLIALVSNLCFLANIIRVLVTKLRSTHANEPAQFRRAVRATLVLIPLFGVHFFLVIYHPRTGDCWGKQVYANITYAIDGLQGCVVALIFCYLNNEVIYLLKRSYKRRRLVQNVSNNYTSGRGMSSRMSVSTNTESITANEVGSGRNSSSKPTKK